MLHNTFIPTKNGEVFFRNDNSTTWDWAVRLAPQQVTEHGLDEHTPLRVLDAGCSRARQTWALAALLATNEMHFLIDAADVNPEVLKDVREPYEDTMDKIKKSLTAQGLPLACLNYFETVDRSHVRPVPELHPYVQFSHMDFRTQSFPPSTHHTTILNNVIGHYYSDKQERRTGVTVALNAARSLVPGGLLSINTRGKPPREFAWHGLTEDPNLDPDFIAHNFRYQPHTRSQRILFGLQKIIFR